MIDVTYIGAVSIK